jgi:histidine triad (HIT) family protein
MSLDGAYDEDNVFAKILRGDMPCVKVHEDADTLSFMDVFPQSPGHLLVISKTSRARTILEMEPAVLAILMAQVQRHARAVRDALSPDGVMIGQFNGEASGQTVFHLHFHVIPRYAGQPMGRHGEGMANMDELKAQAGAIAAKLS